MWIFDTIKNYAQSAKLLYPAIKSSISDKVFKKDVIDESNKTQPTTTPEPEQQPEQIHTKPERFVDLPEDEEEERSGIKKVWKNIKWFWSMIWNAIESLTESTRMKRFKWQQEWYVAYHTFESEKDKLPFIKWFEKKSWLFGDDLPDFYDKLDNSDFFSNIDKPTDDLVEYSFKAKSMSKNMGSLIKWFWNFEEYDSDNMDFKDMSLRSKVIYWSHRLLELNEMYNSWNYDKNEIVKKINEIKDVIWQSYQDTFKWEKYFQKDYDFKKNYSDAFTLMGFVDKYEQNMETAREQSERREKKVKKMEELSERQDEFDKNITHTTTKETQDIFYNEFAPEKLNDIKQRIKGWLTGLTYEWRVMTIQSFMQIFESIETNIMQEVDRYNQSLVDLQWFSETSWYYKNKILENEATASKYIKEWFANQLSFYSYLIDNIWTEWHTTFKEIQKSYEENTWMKTEDMFFIKKEWKEKWDKLLIRNRVADLVNKSQMMNALDSEDIDVVDSVYKAFSFLISWTGMLWRKTVWYVARQIFNLEANPNTNDAFARAWRRTHRTEMKEAILNQQTLKKSMSVFADQTAPVVAWIAEMWLWSKLLTWWKDIAKIRKLAQETNAMTKAYKSAAQTLSATKNAEEAIAIAIKANKDINFWTAALKSFGVKLFEQTVLIPSYFQAARLDSYKEEDFALDMLFWLTIDLLDSYKHVKRLTTLSDKQAISYMMKSDAFSEELAKNMFGKGFLGEAPITLWKDYKWWDNLTNAEKNVLKSYARWYMDFLLLNLAKAKKEAPLSHKEIVKKLKEIVEEEPMIKTWMSDRWDSLLMLEHQRLAALKKYEKQLMVQKDLNKIEYNELLEEKGMKKTTDWNWIYQRKSDKFSINASYQKDPKTGHERKQTYLKYFLNNIVPQKQRWMADNIISIKIWDRVFTVEHNWAWKEIVTQKDVGKDGALSLVKDITLRNEAGEVVDWDFVLYITKNNNINLAFADERWLEALTKSNVEIPRWTKRFFDWNISVKLRWDNTQSEKVIKDYLNYDLDLSDLDKFRWGLDEVQTKMAEAINKLKTLQKTLKKKKFTNSSTENIKVLQDEVDSYIKKIEEYKRAKDKLWKESRQKSKFIISTDIDHDFFMKSKTITIWWREIKLAITKADEPAAGWIKTFWDIFKKIKLWKKLSIEKIVDDDLVFLVSKSPEWKLVLSLDWELISKVGESRWKELVGNWIKVWDKEAKILPIRLINDASGKVQMANWKKAVHGLIKLELSNYFELKDKLNGIAKRIKWIIDLNDQEIKLLSALESPKKIELTKAKEARDLLYKYVEELDMFNELLREVKEDKSLLKILPENISTEYTRHLVFAWKMVEDMTELWIPITNELQKDIVSIIKIINLSSKDTAWELYTKIKNAKIDARLKTYLLDTIQWKSYYKKGLADAVETAVHDALPKSADAISKSLSSTEKSYLRAVEHMMGNVKDANRFPEYAEIFRSVSDLEFEDVITTYLAGNWKTMKGFHQELWKKGIAIKNVTDTVLENFLESIVEADTKRWRIRNLFKRNVENIIKYKNRELDLSLKVMDELFDERLAKIKKFESDPVFMRRYSEFDLLENNWDVAKYLNNVKNEWFRQDYAEYVMLYDDLDFIVEQSFWKITYSDFLKDHRAWKSGLAAFAMDKKLNQLWDYLDKPKAFFNKRPLERLSEVLWDLYMLTWNLKEKDVEFVKVLHNIMWDMLPADARKFISRMKEWSLTHITMDEWLREWMKKDMKELGIDREIEEIKRTIDSSKKILGVVDTEMNKLNKFLFWRSSLLWKKLFPQAQDYIGDWYLEEAEMFRSIVNWHATLPDWTSLKDMLLVGNKIQKNFLRGLKKADEFIADIVKYAKWEWVEQAKATTEYIKQIKDAISTMNSFYDTVIEKLWHKYWSEFVENVRKMKTDISEKNISHFADMLEHGDWMEMIRYADFDMFEKLSIDHKLANKLWGVPTSEIWKEWKYSARYNRKRIWAMNELSHNSITHRQAQTMWWFMKDVYVQWIKKWWNKITSSKVGNAVWWTAKLPFYVASQTFIKPAQAIMLLLMNAQATAVDFIVDSRKGWTSKDLFNFRKKYNILIDVGEVAQAEVWPLRKLMEWEAMTAKKFMKETADRVWDIVVDSSRLGLYNAFEIWFDPAFRNSSVRKALLDITWCTTMKEFDDFMSMLSKTEQEDTILRIQRRAQDQYVLRTANSINVTEWKYLYWDPYSLGGNIKKTLWWAYHFLSARWNQHIKNYFTLISWGSRKLEKIYWELLVSVWREQADILFKDYVNRNQDIIVFVQKMIAAISIWDKMNRNDQKSSRDPRYGRDWMDIFSLWMSVFAPAQWLMSSAAWRQVINSFKSALLDLQYEWVDINNWLAMMMWAIETMMSNMWRRMLLLNSFMWALGSREVKKSVGDRSEADAAIVRFIENWADFAKDFFSNIDTYTEWYTKFLSDDIIERGYKTKLPTTSTSDLDLVLPDLAYFKDKYWELGTLDRINALEKQIKDKWFSAVWDWMVYKRPLEKRYNVGMIDWARKWLDQVMTDWYLHPYSTPLMDWKIPEEIKTDEFNDMIFYHLTRWNILKWHADQKMENWQMVSKWLDNMNKVYLTKKWDVKREQQNQENIFFKYMVDMLKEWQYEQYLKEFNRTDNTWVKAWLRFLWTIDALLEWDTPWASYALIGAIANDLFRWLYNEERKKAGYEYGKEPEEFKDKVSAPIRKHITDALGETLYVTNAPYRCDVTRYVASVYLPEHRDKFTNAHLTEDSVDEKTWESNYFLKTYFGTKLAYEATGWKDSKSTWLWNLDIYNTLAVMKWDISVPEMTNWFNLLLMPKNEAHAKDYDVQKFKLGLVKILADQRNDSALPEQAKINWLVSLWLAVEPILSAVINDEDAVAAIGKENIDTVANLLRGTVNRIWDLDKDQLMAVDLMTAFKQMKNEKWDWPKDLPTGTLMDLYDKNWNYYSTSIWSSKNYSYNKPYRDKFRYNMQKLNLWKNYSWGYQQPKSSYYNNTLSNYFYYKSYYKDAKSKWATISPGKERITRMFTTKKTAVKSRKRKQ